ncbi:MAG: orotidine-5'-phosphate decarboxylase [Treponema sp.]|nr:orotidine-5'-phosphate decarboxylase [Treponema sp.]
MHNMDKLYESVAKRGHVCVGLDTSPEYIPEAERSRAATDADAVFAFNKAIIDSTIDIAACFKVQIAYYEELGLSGLQTFSKTLKYIRERGALVISDIKRGDIADTASRYAKAHFEGDFETDFVTLSPFLGMDSLEPWLNRADNKGKGAFVLLRTSNTGREDFQCLKTAEGRQVYNLIGDKMSALASAKPGKTGYGAFGVVVGIDSKSEEERREAMAIRSERPNLFFLIPGYGAQGGAAADVSLLLREGNGGVVNASRSILRAWQASGKTDNADNSIAAKHARDAAIAMRDEILDNLR